MLGSSFFQSPKSLLAQKLAEILSVYFQVDATRIQSNLVTDTKIVLPNLGLKPVETSGCLIVGSIRHVEFAWKWGGDTSTSFIRETSLSLQGVEVHVLIKDASAVEFPIPPEEASQQQQQEADTIGAYVQQIIDHLALRILDVKITLQTMDQDSIVVESKTIDLESKGRQNDSTALTQRLSVTSLLAYTLDTNGVRFPLMDAVPYAISIDRLSGRRFQGISHGLRAIGESLGELVLYADQFPMLFEMMELWRQKTASLEQPHPTKDCSEPVTIGDLSVPPISLHLKNGCIVRLPQSRLEVAIDGSMMRFSGSEGLEIDGEALLTLKEGTMWSFDATTMSLTVENKLNGDLLAEGILRESVLKRLMHGMWKIPERATTVQKKVDTIAIAPPKFIMNIRGNLVTTFCGGTEEESLTITMGPCSLSSDVLSIAALQLHGNLQKGQVHVDIPSVSYSRNEGSLSVLGEMKAMVDSLGTLERLQNSIKGSVESLGLSGAGEVSTGVNSINVSVHIPAAAIQISESVPISLNAENVKVLAEALTVQSVTFSSKDQFKGKAEGLVLERKGPDTLGKIESISSFQCQGLGKFQRTPAVLSMRYSQNTLELNISGVNFCLEEDCLVQNSSSEQPLNLPLLPGLSILVNLSDFAFTFPTLNRHQLSVTNAKFHVSQNHEKRATMVKCSGIKDICWDVSSAKKAAIICMPFRVVLDPNGNFLKGKLEGCQVDIFGNKTTAISLKVPSVHGDSLTRKLTVGQTLMVNIQSVDSALCSFHECWPSTIGQRPKRGTNESLLQSLGDFCCSLQHLKCDVEGPLLLAADVKSLAIEHQSKESNVHLKVGDCFASLATVGSFQAKKPLDVTVSFDSSETELQVCKFQVGFVLSDAIEATMTFGLSSAKLNGSFEFQSVVCSGIDVASQKFGCVDISLPRLEYDCLQSKVELVSSIRCSIGSLQSTMQDSQDCITALNRLQSYLDQCFSGRSHSGKQMMSLRCPEAQIAVDEALMLLFELKNVVVEDNTVVRFDSLVVSSGNLRYLAIHGISATVASARSTMQIAHVTELLIPGTARLQSPLVNAAVEYSAAGGIQIKGSLCEVSLLLSSRSTNSSSDASSIPQLPVSLACSFQRLIVFADGEKSTCDNVLLSSSQGMSSMRKPSLRFQCQVSKFSNVFAEITNISIHCNIVDHCVVENLEVAISSALVRAGFSSMQWSKMFAPKQESSTPAQIYLPNAHVKPILARVEYNGAVLSTAASLHLPEYKGNLSASLESLVTFYTESVYGQMPSFFSNSTILGGSVVDMSASSTGRVMVGGTLGSVGGIAALDGIKGAISSGKKDRGASDNDGYQFGDFTRGTVRAVKEATKAGTKSRSDDRYQFGDFSRGVAASLTKYGDKNRERLGAAGGSSFGMMVGTAALGPLGLVAGAVAGSVAGAKALKKADNSDKDSSNMTGSDNIVSQQLPETNLASSGYSAVGRFAPAGSAPPASGTPVSQSFSSVQNNASTHRDMYSSTVPTTTVGHKPIVNKSGDDFFSEWLDPSEDSSKLKVNAQQPQASNTARPFIPCPPAKAGVVGNPMSQSVSSLRKGTSSQRQMHGTTVPNSTVHHRSVQSDSNSDFFSDWLDPNEGSSTQRSNAQRPHAPKTLSRPVNVGQPNPHTQSFQHMQHQPRPHLQNQPYAHNQHQPYVSGQSQPHTQSYAHVQRESRPQVHPQSYSHNQSHPHTQPQTQWQANRQEVHQTTQPPQTEQQSGYRFGDLTRSVISRGKELRDADASDAGYKFGDFTRGLFGSGK